MTETETETDTDKPTLPPPQKLQVIRKMKGDQCQWCFEKLVASPLDSTVILCKHCDDACLDDDCPNMLCRTTKSPKPKPRGDDN